MTLKEFEKEVEWRNNDVDFDYNEAGDCATAYYNTVDVWISFHAEGITYRFPSWEEAEKAKLFDGKTLREVFPTDRIY